MSGTSTALAQARTAYHLLMTGRSARVVVDQNGERVEFTSANAERLQAYIAALASGLTVPRPTGPIGFLF